MRCSVGLEIRAVGIAKHHCDAIAVARRCDPRGFPVATDVTCPDLSSLGVNRYIERPSDFNRKEAVLCDAHQLDRPLALHELDSGQTIGFISDTVIGNLQPSGAGSPNPSAAIRMLDITNQQVSTVATVQGYVQGVAWSHEHSMVAFMTYTAGALHFWLKRGSGPPAEVMSPIPIFGRGGAEGDQSLVAFSPDDRYVLFVETVVADSLHIFRTSDGGQAFTAPSDQGGTMATWAHRSNQLYFRNSSGIYQWDPTSGNSTFAAGVKWENPAFSPDDRHLAYTVWDSTGKTQIVLRDMNKGTTSLSPPWRLSEGFLSNAVVLERVTKACDGLGMCGPFDYTEERRTLRLDSSAEAQLQMPAGWGLDVFLQAASSR